MFCTEIAEIVNRFVEIKMVLKGTVSVMDSSCNDVNVRFTTISLKDLSDHGLVRY